MSSESEDRTTNAEFQSGGRKKKRGEVKVKDPETNAVFLKKAGNTSNEIKSDITSIVDEMLKANCMTFEQHKRMYR